MAHVSHTRRRHLVPVTTNRSRVLLPQPPVFDSWSKPCQTPPLIGACSTSTVTDNSPDILWRLAEYLGVQPEIAMALGADLDIDPTLLAHALPGSPYDAPDCNNPPSPIDINMIDPELLALYPAPDPSPPLAAAAVVQPGPPDDANHSDTATCVDAVCTGAAPSPSPGSANVSCSVAADKKHAASGRKRRPPSISAVGKAKRTRSDGVLVPPTPCARCIDLGRRDECRVVYDGAACNKCRQRGRKRARGLDIAAADSWRPTSESRGGSYVVYALT